MLSANPRFNDDKLLECWESLRSGAYKGEIPEEAKKIQQVPGSLDESLRALEKDHAFLLRGNVFTDDVIQTWLEYKWKREVDPVRIRPHPWEFYLYFDV